MYAPGPEIREYIEGTAKKYGADRFIRLRHEVTQCHWSREDGKWHVRVKRPTGEIIDDQCDVLGKNFSLNPAAARGVPLTRYTMQYLQEGF